MNVFSDNQLKLIRRALILLSCVVTGEEAKQCLDAADKIASEFRVRNMLREDEQIEGGG